MEEEEAKHEEERGSTQKVAKQALNATKQLGKQLEKGTEKVLENLPEKHHRKPYTKTWGKLEESQKQWRLQARNGGQSLSHKRPGRTANGKSDGTMGIGDIQSKLTEYNNGVQPSSAEVMKVLVKCPTNGIGRLKESDWELFMEQWLARDLSMDRSELKAQGSGRGCVIS